MKTDGGVKALVSEFNRKEQLKERMNRKDTTGKCYNFPILGITSILDEKEKLQLTVVHKTEKSCRIQNGILKGNGNTFELMKQTIENRIKLRERESFGIEDKHYTFLNFDKVEDNYYHLN